MERHEDFGWLSLLQRRADYARKAASAARSPEIAKELKDLAAVYEEAMEHGASAATSAEAKSQIVRHLQGRANEFLMEARKMNGKARGDDFKYLAGLFGAEAARVKSDAVR